MKVAIDVSPLNSGDRIRGIGFHTKELLSELQNLRDNNFKIDAVDFKNTDLSKYDVIHYPYFNPHQLTLPFIKPSKKVVVTIHDLIRLIYPKAYPPGVRGTINFYLQKFNLRNVDAVITISETSKKDIVRLLNFPPDKIYVTYLAPQTRVKDKFTASILKLPDKYVLYIGDVNYNKNLTNLADACKLAKLKLVIVGKQSVEEEVNSNIEMKPWKEFLNKYKNDKDILRLGYVENLDEVFKKASVYCQPSLYEGFGLPVLEAFERKVPVVASKTQALVEVGKDGCLYADPRNPRALSEALRKVVSNKNLSKELIKKGTERLKFFSWVKCAKETKKIYEKI